jgi:hypothetical protein
MTIETLTTFFMWCTILGMGVLIFSTFMILLLKDVAFKMHGKMFGLSRPAFNTAIYGYLGLMKILVLVFCAIPYIALLIMK